MIINLLLPWRQTIVNSRQRDVFPLRDDLQPKYRLVEGHMRLDKGMLHAKNTAVSTSLYIRTHTFLAVSMASLSFFFTSSSSFAWVAATSARRASCSCHARGKREGEIHGVCVQHWGRIKTRLSTARPVIWGEEENRQKWAGGEGKRG